MCQNRMYIFSNVIYTRNIVDLIQPQKPFFIRNLWATCYDIK